MPFTVCRNLKVSVNFPKFQLSYWVSFSKQNGAMIESDRITMDVSLKADRRTIDDGLKRKPSVTWCIQHFSSHLNNGVVWLCSANSPMHEKKKVLHETKFSLYIRLNLIHTFLQL